MQDPHRASQFYVNNRGMRWRIRTSQMKELGVSDIEYLRSIGVPVPAHIKGRGWAARSMREKEEERKKAEADKKAKRDAEIRDLEDQLEELKKLGWEAKEAGDDDAFMGFKERYEDTKSKLDLLRATPLARGGIVMPRPGGVPAVLAEAGEEEVVAPLSDLPGLLADTAPFQYMQQRFRALESMLAVGQTIRVPELPDARAAAQGPADMPVPDANGGRAATKPQFTVVLDGDLKKLGPFVRAKVLEGDIRGRQEVFRR